VRLYRPDVAPPDIAMEDVARVNNTQAHTPPAAR
jgi:hypothetical protein